MNRRFPPFSAVRAFEAAARNLSFKRAAEELHVSQSAISHQIKNLETYLETPLFRRGPQGVALTPSGGAYLTAVTGILDSLDRCTDSLRQTGDSGPLRIQTTPAFASRWLVPRIRRFNHEYPDIELHLSTSVELPDFEAGSVDFLVQYGMERIEGLTVTPLMTSSRAPVCSPELLRDGPPVRVPADLRHYRLLRDMVGDRWDEWLRRASVDTSVLDGSPRYAHCELTLRAAEEAQGFALGYIALLEDAIATGTLVMPFALETAQSVIYSTVYPARCAHHRKIRVFESWLRAEIDLETAAPTRPELSRRAV